jgi:hypothetical protein
MAKVYLFNYDVPEEFTPVEIIAKAMEKNGCLRVICR